MILPTFLSSILDWSVKLPQGKADTGHKNYRPSANKQRQLRLVCNRLCVWRERWTWPLRYTLRWKWYAWTSCEMLKGETSGKVSDSNEEDQVEMFQSSYVHWCVLCVSWHFHRIRSWDKNGEIHGDVLRVWWMVSQGMPEHTCEIFGLYAIGFAFDVSAGRGLTNTHYDESGMRDHLAKCLKEKQLEWFPILTKKIRSKYFSRLFRTIFCMT